MPDIKPLSLKINLPKFGATSFSKCSALSAKKSKISALLPILMLELSKISRKFSPSCVPPGSFVTMASLNLEAKISICVLLPTPSMPSNKIYILRL